MEGQMALALREANWVEELPDFSSRTTPPQSVKGAAICEPGFGPYTMSGRSSRSPQLSNTRYTKVFNTGAIA